MAAALRLLLRRRAAASLPPSLALRQPLFPSPYSKLSATPVPSLLRPTSAKGCSVLPPLRKPTDRDSEVTHRPIQPSSPLLAVTAAASLPGVQCMQVQPSPPQVPSLIRHYSSKICDICQGLRQPFSPLLAVTAAASLPGVQCMQIQPSPPQVPSLIRHYSSKGCARAPPLPQQLIDRQICDICQDLRQMKSLDGVVNNLAKQIKLMKEGVKTCVKASKLLDAGVDDDRAFAMFENGFDGALKAIAVGERVVDVLAKGFRRIKAMRHIDLEWHRIKCKQIKNSLESKRQMLKEWRRSIETQRTLKKTCKWLKSASVILGAFILLMWLINMGICLA